MMNAARAGEKEAQGRLLELFRPILSHLARRRLAALGREDWSGSDVVQATFIKALREILTCQGSTPGQVLAWLRAILERTILDQEREERAAKRGGGRVIAVANSDLSRSVDPAAAPADERIAYGERSRRVRAAVARLPEESRRVVELMVEGNLSWKEIGERTGRTAAAARSLFARAKQKLREELGDPSEW